MMTNTQSTIQKPQLDGIQIYIDGELDKRQELERYAKLSLKLTAWATYKGLESVIMAVDRIYAAANQK